MRKMTRFTSNALLATLSLTMLGQALAAPFDWQRFKGTTINWNEPSGQDHKPRHFARVSSYADYTAKEPRCQDGITAVSSSFRWSAR